MSPLARSTTTSTRVTSVVENWVSGASPPTGDQHRTTEWNYDGFDNVTRLTASNIGGGSGSQFTEYKYDFDYNASWPTTITYPDGGAAFDNVTIGYSLDGRRTFRKDQRGVIMLFGYDGARRPILENATAVSNGFGFHSDINAISYAFDDYGRLSRVASHNFIGAGGDILNEVVRTYHDGGPGQQGHGRLYREQQAVDGAVDGTTPFTEYLYDDTAAPSGEYTDGLRMTTTNYPAAAGAKADYIYGGERPDRLRRVSALTLNSGGLGNAPVIGDIMEYNGLARVARVQTFGGSANIERRMYSASGNYDAWDRFGRVERMAWSPTGQPASPFDQTDYTYDFASNRLTRDTLAPPTNARDQLYDYDGLHRLKTMDEGTLASGAIASPSREQDWTLDQQGNWAAYQEQTGGQVTLNSTRAHNAANELINFSPSTFNISTYDEAGNMLRMPQPGNPQTELFFAYDAWNRPTLVNKQHQNFQVCEYRYDGLGRRIAKVAPGGAEQRFYYNHRWQVLTETDGADAATAVYCWRPSYVDALGAKVTAAGAHVFTHDALASTTAAVDTSTGQVAERYHYDPYGRATVLDDAYNAVAGNQSTIGNEHLFTGRRIDPETGLQYSRNRYYHTGLGRWTTRDPIGYLGGDTNLYGYVGGMPTFYVDPLGLETMLNPSGPGPVIPDPDPTPAGDMARCILKDPEINKRLRDDWKLSNDDRGFRGKHERGGTIIRDKNGKFRVERWRPGGKGLYTTSSLVDSPTQARR